MTQKLCALAILLSISACGPDVTVLQGPAGAKGDTGDQGVQGETGSQGEAGPQGNTGPQGETGATGPQGPVGPQGPQGEPGTPGNSCSVAMATGGAVISCTDGSSVFVTAGTVVQNIELCPAISGGLFHEYLEKIDGSYYGVYASGNNVGRTKLWAGSWVTTDGRNCHFVITGAGAVIFP